MRDLTKAYEIIKEFEGLYLSAYKDPVGIPTIGWGTIEYPNGNKVKLGDKITKGQAQQYLEHEVSKILPAIDSAVKVSLNDNEYCAIVSFCYNCGTGAFKSSTMLRLLNEGKPRAEVADQFDRWVKAGGKTLAGLVRRRAEEKKLFLTPVDQEAIDKGGVEIETPDWFEPFKALIIKLLEAVFGKDSGVIPEDADESQTDKIIRLNPQINPLMIKRAMKERQANISKFSKNEKYMTLVDFSKYDYEERMYFIDMDTCEAVSLPEKGIVAHGAKSDKNKDNLSETFSNVSGSNCSSLGLKRFAESYVSSKRKTGSNFSFTKSRRIDGLDPKLNGNERARACVLHDGFYVTIARAAVNNVGDSLGCLVPTQKNLYFIFDKIEGSMLYCWHRSLED